MSDLHIGYKDLYEHFKVIVKNIIFEKGDNPENYVILITGDLVENANNVDNYYKVKEQLDILKLAGFNNILLVPGNHDYGTGTVGNNKFVKFFKAFYYDCDYEYPKLDIIKNNAFIGLDSMAEELHWYDKLFAQGELGDKQLKRLESILQSNEVNECERIIVYLHHHPFDPWLMHQLNDSNKLKEVLIKYPIDILLYGHNHAGRVHNGQWGISRCYDAGTATDKPSHPILSKISGFKNRVSTRVIDTIKNDPPFYDYKEDFI